MDNTDDFREGQELEVKVVLSGANIMATPDHKGLYSAISMPGDLLWVSPEVEGGFFKIVEGEWKGKWIYIGNLAPTGRSREGTAPIRIDE